MQTSELFEIFLEIGWNKSHAKNNRRMTSKQGYRKEKIESSLEKKVWTKIITDTL